MIEIFTLLVNLLGDFINFLIDFKIIGSLSLFSIFVLLFLFNFAMKFLFNDKEKK